MILPFVRELLADMEHTPAFEQARRHLALARGRRRVSGLTSTARALYIPLFARAVGVPVVVLVTDNKAADAMHLALRSGCELTGAIPPDHARPALRGRRQDSRDAQGRRRVHAGPSHAATFARVRARAPGALTA